MNDAQWHDPFASDPLGGAGARDRRKQVGRAIWLLAFLGLFSPDTWDGMQRVVVAGGNVISDSELADRLQVTASTISCWRRRLKRAGLLDWLVSRGNGRVLFLRGMSQMCAGSDSRNPTSSASPPNHSIQPHSIDGNEREDTANGQPRPWVS